MNHQLAMALPLPATSAESRIGRDRGIRRTESVNSAWQKAAFESLRRYCVGRAEVTCEEFRHWWLANGGLEPTSHHAWGALGNAMSRCDWLSFERYQQAKSIKTHAHPVRVYRVVGMANAA